MSEYDCVGVTSEYLETLKNKIKELEQQKAELREALKDVLNSVRYGMQCISIETIERLLN